jgi:4-amino-4-deoxy-L-arabinose transferase-like glycosyltransferase
VKTSSHTIARQPAVAIPVVSLTAYCLIAIWLGIGLLGRDPWKPDEAYTVGIVNHLEETGEWIVPKLADEPFMEKPPLFYATAAAFAEAFEDVVAVHDAARLATAFYVALTILFTALTARRLFGEDRAIPCALLLISCIGYVHTAHLLVTDNALVAGIAVSLYGFSMSRDLPRRAGLWIAAGAGVAFLSKGLIGPGFLALTALVLPSIPTWRTRTYAEALACAMVAFVPFAVIWPLLLYRESPALFHEWLIVNNFGRYTGTANLGPDLDHWMYLRILPWFALPVWPFAVWNAWRCIVDRREAILLPLVMAAVMLVVLSSANNSRYLYATPMLVPLTVMAACNDKPAPRWLARCMAYFAIAVGAALALFLWVAWVAARSGWPAQLAVWVTTARPGFEFDLEPSMMAMALAATGASVLLTYRNVRAAEPAPVIWATCVTGTWVLIMTLWVGYLDYGNTYRSVVSAVRHHLPRNVICVASRGLGEPQRAMLQYFGDIITRREEIYGDYGCDTLLIQKNRSAAEPAHDPQWRLVWSGGRPGDHIETFWLYARTYSHIK